MKIIKLIGFLSLGLLYAFQASLPTNSPFPERQTLPTVKSSISLIRSTTQ